MSLNDSTSTVCASQDASFVRFNDFPNEIRDMIWRFSMSSPRTVLLRKRQRIRNRHRVWSDCKNDDEGNVFFSSKIDCGQTMSESKPAVLTYSFAPVFQDIAQLYVCRESYNIASSIYVKAFGSAEAFPETWFDFRRDTLCLDFRDSYWYDLILLENLGDDIKLVENLAICRHSTKPRDARTRPGTLFNRVYEALRHFGNVKKLVVADVQFGDAELRDLAMLEVDEYMNVGAMKLLAGSGTTYTREVDEEFRKLKVDFMIWEDIFQQSYDGADLNEDSITRYDPRHRGDLEFKMPIIERRIITSLDLKREYDWLWARFDKMKRAFETTIHIRSPGLEGMSLRVREHTTMGEVAEVFFRARGIFLSPEKALIENKPGWPASIDSTVNLLDLKDNCMLHIYLP